MAVKVCVNSPSFKFDLLHLIVLKCLQSHGDKASFKEDVQLPAAGFPETLDFQEKARTMLPKFFCSINLVLKLYVYSQKSPKNRS